MIHLCFNIIKQFARLLRYIGIIGFLSGSITFLNLNMKIPNSIEMPLGDLSGLAVDSDGNIYCTTLYYARVQVYSPSGRFLRGISIEANGMLWIKINNDDQLEVAVARGDKRFKFDRNGNLLSHMTNVSDYLAGFDKKSEYFYYDEKQRITYQIKPILTSLFGKHIVEKDASGKETVIIGTPFLKWLFMGPFPAFFFIIFSALLSLIFDKKLREGLFEQIQKHIKASN